MKWAQRCRCSSRPRFSRSYPPVIDAGFRSIGAIIVPILGVGEVVGCGVGGGGSAAILSTFRNCRCCSSHANPRPGRWGKRTFTVGAIFISFSSIVVPSSSESTPTFAPTAVTAITKWPLPAFPLAMMASPTFVSGMSFSGSPEPGIAWSKGSTRTFVPWGITLRYQTTISISLL